MKPWIPFVPWLTNEEDRRRRRKRKGKRVQKKKADWYVPEQTPFKVLAPSSKSGSNFQYWGKAVTNKKGAYAFKTIKPGSYPVSWFWTRPPHIHFTIQSKQHAPFTTQMYFSGERFNENDRLLQEHSKTEQEKCIVAFRKISNQKVGQFNITLI